MGCGHAGSERCVWNSSAVGLLFFAAPRVPGLRYPRAAPHASQARTADRDRRRAALFSARPVGISPHGDQGRFANAPGISAEEVRRPQHRDSTKNGATRTGRLPLRAARTPEGAVHLQLDLPDTAGADQVPRCAHRPGCRALHGPERDARCGARRSSANRRRVDRRMFHERARRAVPLGPVPRSLAVPLLAGGHVYGVSQSLSAASCEPLAPTKWAR